MNWLDLTTSGSTGAQTAATAATTATKDKDVNKEVFLQLLVAQLRNQDPLNPSDGVEFVTQLAQFTSLEQQISMRQALEAIRGALAPADAAAGNP